MPYGPEPETPGGRRQVTVASVVFIAALAVPYSSQGFQQQVALMLQGSALAPFIAMQERLAEGRARADQIDFLQAELDSVVAMSATQSVLSDENRELRELLGLAERAGPRFLPATLLRPGTAGSESMFLVNVGAEQGVVEGAPVVSARGLVGVIREVRLQSAVGMDWTHPDFRASGMLIDGSTFGLIENVRGDFREEDRLMLNGTAYHETAVRDGLVVTSGLGGVFPRGIPVGRIDATAEVQGSWRKSYWLRPLVDPGAVTHVLVEMVAGGDDLTQVWAQDTVRVDAPPPPRAPAGRGSAPSPSRPAPAQDEPARVAPVRTPPAQGVVPQAAASPAARSVPPTPPETGSGATAPADSVVPTPADSVAPAPVDSGGASPDTVPTDPAPTDSVPVRPSNPA